VRWTRSARPRDRHLVFHPERHRPGDRWASSYSQRMYRPHRQGDSRSRRPRGLRFTRRSSGVSGGSAAKRSGHTHHGRLQHLPVSARHLSGVVKQACSTLVWASRLLCPQHGDFQSRRTLTPTTTLPTRYLRFPARDARESKLLLRPATRPRRVPRSREDTDLRHASSVLSPCSPRPADPCASSARPSLPCATGRPLELAHERHVLA